MSADTKGVSNSPAPSDPQETYADFWTEANAYLPNEGIITGLEVVPTTPASTSVKVQVGYLAIELDSVVGVVVRELETEFTVAIPDNTNGTYTLILGKENKDNYTFDIVAVSGASGLSTDPSIPEGGSPDVYYFELARVESNGLNITASEIVQDGVTTTNNGDNHIIGRTTAIRSDLAPVADDWSDIPGTLTYNAFDANLNVATANSSVDLTTTVKVGDKIRITQTTDGEKFGDIVFVSASSINVFLSPDYDFDNEAITNAQFSKKALPDDFPTTGRWEVRSSINQSVTGIRGITTEQTITSVTLPAGAFDIEFNGYLRMRDLTATTGTTMFIGQAEFRFKEGSTLLIELEHDEAEPSIVNNSQVLITRGASFRFRVYNAVPTTYNFTYQNGSSSNDVDIAQFTGILTVKSPYFQS
jgi:hypothetical protein